MPKFRRVFLKHLTLVLGFSAVLGFLNIQATSALSSHQIGNTTYYSDGSKSYTIGDTIYYHDSNGKKGTIYQIGDTTYFRDSSGNKAKSYEIGNTTYFRDTNGNKTTSHKIGDTTYVRDNYGNKGTIYEVGGTKYYKGDIFKNGAIVYTTLYSAGSNTSSYASGSASSICPINSTRTSKGCACNTGYIPGGSKCIQASAAASAKAASAIKSTYIPPVTDLQPRAYFQQEAQEYKPSTFKTPPPKPQLYQYTPYNTPTSTSTPPPSYQLTPYVKSSEQMSAPPPAYQPSIYQGPPPSTAQSPQPYTPTTF